VVADVRLLQINYFSLVLQELWLSLGALSATAPMLTLISNTVVGYFARIIITE
jgi:hypothetical protein